MLLRTKTPTKPVASVLPPVPTATLVRPAVMQPHAQAAASPTASGGYSLAHVDAHPTGADPQSRQDLLPDRLRTRMEAAFGQDFSRVRVHRTDKPAAIGAVAYAQGEHVHFAPGRYQPTSAAGQRVIAHELAHVVQQRRQRVPMPRGVELPINDAPELEAEADRAAARALQHPAGNAVRMALPAGSQHRSEPGPSGARPIQPQWEDERVLGHSAAASKKVRSGGGHDDQTKGVVREIQDAIQQLKEERAQAKQKVMAGIYEKRAQFSPILERDQVKPNKSVDDFLKQELGPHDPHVAALQDARKQGSTQLKKFGESFGPDSDYLEKLQEHDFTSGRLEEQLGRADLRFVDHPKTNQTRVHYKGKHIYTLHRGASAFYDKERAAAGRMVLGKHGSDKEYTRDDQGVPTRRYAYAVKDKKQVGILNSGRTLKGRFVLPKPTGLGRQSIMDATPMEQAQVLGRKHMPKQPRNPDAVKYPGAQHTLNDMLMIHQEYGSDKRQRGVSATSTPYALLSNEGRGFAKPDDRGARKLEIDLATIPKKKRKSRIPNLINYHQQIPEFSDKRIQARAIHKVSGTEAEKTLNAGQVLYPAAQGQEHLDWSTSKNRELFIRELTRKNIVNSYTPSPLERMTYFTPPAEEGGEPKIVNNLAEKVKWEKEKPAAHKRLRARIKQLRDQRTSQHALAYREALRREKQGDAD